MHALKPPLLTLAPYHIPANRKPEPGHWNRLQLLRDLQSA